MKQNLSNGPDPDELFEVPQRDGTMLRKRRDDLDFDDLTARCHASDDSTERRNAKELRAKREADEHRAELSRLKKLRDKKGSRDLGKVSLPPKAPASRGYQNPACYCDLASGHRLAFMTTACWQRSNVSMPTMAANRTVSWY